MSASQSPLMGAVAVPQYSILTLSITGETGLLNSTADAVVQAVSADLSADGRMTVVGSPSVGGSIADTILGTVASLSYSQPFQVTMQVQVNTAFANQNDPLSIVENFFQQESGYFPTAASVTAIQTPGQTQAQATGVAAASPAGIGGTSLSTSISNFWSSLTSTAQTLLIALIGIVVLVLVLIAYGPNVGKVAQAAL
jgi:hypothetical protein